MVDIDKSDHYQGCGKKIDNQGFRGVSKFHQRGNRLTSVDSIERLFTRFGVSADEFNKAWNSFPVNQKMRLAGDLARRYGVKSVPAFVVAGKYRTSVADAGSLDDLFALFEELLAREGLN